MQGFSADTTVILIFLLPSPKKNCPQKLFDSEIFSCLKLSNFSGWRNSLYFLWCRYISIILIQYSITYTQGWTLFYKCLHLSLQFKCQYLLSFLPRGSKLFFFSQANWLSFWSQKKMHWAFERCSLV